MRLAIKEPRRWFWLCVGCVLSRPLREVRLEIVDALELPDVLPLELECDASDKASRFGTRDVEGRG